LLPGAVVVDMIILVVVELVGTLQPLEQSLH
jgi:hypothetical protein